MDEEQTVPCADKLVFDSREQAEGSAAAIQYQRGTDLKVYRCTHCDLWHLASK